MLFKDIFDADDLLVNGISSVFGLNLLFSFGHEDNDFSSCVVSKTSFEYGDGLVNIRFAILERLGD